jgi:hypothetical protein
MVRIVNLQLLLQIVPLMEDEQCLSQKVERKVTSQAKPSQEKRDQPYVVARWGVHPHHQKLT